MPGYRGREERDVTVTLRLPEKLKGEWSAYASHDGISALIRAAVAEFMARHPAGKKGTCPVPITYL